MTEKTYVVFSINSDHYAIDVLDIQQIVAFTNVDIKPAKAPEFVLGITYFQKTIAPILDIEMMYLHRKAEPNLYDTVLFVAVDGEFLGILIKQAPNVIALKEDAVCLGKLENSALSDFLESSAKIQDKIYNIFNVKLFLSKNIPSKLLINEAIQNELK